MKNRITELFEIEFPIIQAGMVWVSGWKLASAVSNCGGLGLIGAGSMKPDLLVEHIQKCRNATSKNFGVNIPLLRKDAEELIDVVIHEKVKVVFTSAGHPGKFIEKLKANKIKVVHVVSNVSQGMKAESVGCDGIVGEGVEAGGHNGKDELTTFCLIPQLAENISVPVIAAGGIASGKGILAALSLGAEAVQIGTLFASSIESSANQSYKASIVKSNDRDTILLLRKLGPTRMLKNLWTKTAEQYELNGADETELKNLVGEKRERLGIFEGDTENGMLEAGQCAGLINSIDSVEKIFKKLIFDFDSQLNHLKNLS
ncbi:MAG: nitronate monooxygenase [Ignavibacteriales bacterium CG_4_9_14_3_um_filter_34_10]|nr:MAG: nitronate monooxygenase [Ignavibacteriales bacterium CG_4_9_14_3_um_filter_34_10]